jgi:hypothetical protein
MPGWNPITGHLLSLVPFLKHFPKDAIHTYPIGELSKSAAKADKSINLDMGPIMSPVLVVAPADMAIQACQQQTWQSLLF